MANISTPHQQLKKSVKTSRPTPRKSTLDFVRQFARAYNPVPSLHPAISTIILN